MHINKHVDAYTDFLLSKFSPKRALTVVCDCSNGPTALVIHTLQERLAGKLTISVINDTLDPDFPAHGADPTEPGALEDIRKEVLKKKADLGIVFDGDGDRAVFIDESGHPIDAHVVGGYLMSKIEGTHVADALIYEALVHGDPSLKDRVIPSRVGRFFINEMMHEKNGMIGAELSGHYYFSDFWHADSGILTMLKFIQELSRESSAASDSLSSFSKHKIGADKMPMTISMDVLKKRLMEHAISKDLAHTSQLDGLTIDFGDSWVNVRPSNTEPILRITAGASSLDEVGSIMDEYRRLLS